MMTSARLLSALVVCLLTLAGPFKQDHNLLVQVIKKITLLEDELVPVVTFFELVFLLKGQKQRNLDGLLTKSNKTLDYDYLKSI